MPAHRMPTARLERRGAFKKDPARGRKRAKEPKDLPPIGDPPAFLSPAIRDAWDEVVSNCPKGVLTSADRIAVELVARLVVEMRKKGISGFTAQQLRGGLASLGMTPADRSRVQVIETEKPKSGWDAIDGAPN